MSEQPTPDERLHRYGKAIWEASRADEGTISATGANIVARAVMAVADAEQETLLSGARTLGEIIDKQCRMVLDATGLHDMVNEDGDGDWGAIWDNLFELRSENDRLRARLASVERLAAEMEQDDAVHLNTYGQHLPGPVGRVAELLRERLS